MPKTKSMNLDIGQLSLTEANKELAKWARAANRRIERATPGQREAIQKYTRGYHTRESEKYGRVFKQGKAANLREARQRLTEIKAFMEGGTSTKTGWKKIKEENVKAAGKTIRGGLGLEISDTELATLLEELGANKDKKAYYRYLENVAIAKERKYEKIQNKNKDTIETIKLANVELTDAEIKKAMEMRLSDQKRAYELIKARDTARAEKIVKIAEEIPF